MSFGFPGPPLHPEAKNILAMINTPELLETLSEDDLTKIFERDGFKRVSSSDVYQGWGFLVDEPSMTSKSMFISKDGKLLCVYAGFEGTYAIDCHMQDVHRPTGHEIKLVRNYEQYFPRLQTETVKKLMAELPSPVKATIDAHVQNVKGWIKKLFE